MAQIQTPYLLRDLHSGVYRNASINPFLAPQNSVAHSININYDTILGSAVVRPGTTVLVATVASGKAPLGLGEFVTSGGASNILLSVFKGASNSTLYYYSVANNAWNASGLTGLVNNKNVRFAQIGNRAFMVNGTDAMKSSADGNTWATTDCMTTRTPNLIFRSKQRLLTAGDSGFRDRVWFSSVIDPNASPFITWSEDATTGNFIDINPDDGSNVTGFAETSNTTIVFKTNGMYRLDVINKIVDSANIFNVGAVSQESIVNCQGIVYFFSGYDIRMTDGGFPQQISRLGVQDFIDAIPQANWSQVGAGTDGLNVYFSIGTVTIGFNTYNNVVLKFSTRDQGWSVHSYANQPLFFCQFTNTSNARKMMGADTGGSVQTYNVGTTDNGTAISFILETQEIEFGNRATLKEISDNIVVFSKYGLSSSFSIRADEGDYVPISGSLNKRVNVISGKKVLGNFFTFRWSGSADQKSPIFEGIYLEKVTDKGIVSQ